MPNNKPDFGKNHQALYNMLQQQGYEDLPEYNEFDTMMNDSAKAGQVYDMMKEDGVEGLSNRDSFMNVMNETYYNGSVAALEKQARQQAEAAKKQQQKDAWKRNMIAQVEGMKAQTAATMERAKNVLDYNKNRRGISVKPVKLGQSQNVMVKPATWDINSGKIRETYVTETGNEYEQRGAADLEQNKIDQADMLSTQLEKAYEERERLQEKMNERGEQLDNAMPTVAMGAGQAFTGGSLKRISNEEYKQLMAAYDKNEELIKTLEAERDSDDAGFWRGLGDVVLDPRTWTNGYQQAMNAMTTINYLNGDQKTEAGEEMLRNTALAQGAQARYGDNRSFLYRAGSILGNMTPFALQIGMTGGFQGLAKGGIALADKAAARVANPLLSRMIHYTGVGASELAAGFAVANTAGLGNTLAAIGERNTGNVVLGDDGYFTSEKGENLLEAILKGEVAQTLEYGTEGLGRHMHLGSRLMKGLEKMGASKLTGFLTRASNSGFGRFVGETLDRFGIQGIPEEIMEEQVNLIGNALLVGDNNFSLAPLKGAANDLLGTNFEVDRNSDEYRQSIFNPKTQADIWGGMALSVGFMGAMPGAAYAAGRGYNAAQYYKYKHRMDMAGERAAGLMDANEWKALQETISNTTNADMAGVITGIVGNENYSKEARSAIAEYIKNTMIMRGYNLGSVAAARDAASSEEAPEAAAASAATDRSYVAGYESQGKERNEAAIELEDAQNNLREVLGLSDNADLDAAIGLTNGRTANQVAAMYARNGENAEQKQAVLDYLNARAAYEGIMQRVEDDVDTEVTAAETQIDQRANQEGNVQSATMKADDRQVYVISGDVVMTDDGTMVNTGASSESVVVRDAATGKLEMVSPKDILSVAEAVPADQLKQEAAQNIENEIVEKAAADVEGRLSFEPGSTFTLEIEPGQPVDLTVVGRDEAGNVVVESNGQQAAYSEQMLQNLYDNYNRAQHEQRKAQQQAEAQAAQKGQQDASEEPAEGTQQRQPSALERIEMDPETGAPMIERAPDAATGYDALTEYLGDAAEAADFAATRAAALQQEADKAKKAGDLVGYRAASQAARTWQGIVDEHNARQQAAQQEAQQTESGAAEARQSVSDESTMGQGTEITSEEADLYIGEEQRKELEKVAEALGIKIRFVINAPGVNAYMASDGRTMVINVQANSGLLTNGLNAKQAIFGHELMHSLRDTNPEAYNKLRGLVENIMGAEAWNEAMDKTMRAYKPFVYRTTYNQKIAEGMTEEQAVAEANKEAAKVDEDYCAEEVVCDAAGAMIFNNDILKDYAARLDHPTLAAILQWISDAIDKIRAKIKGTPVLSDLEQAVSTIREAMDKRMDDVIDETARREGIEKETARMLAEHRMTMEGGAPMSQDAARLKAETGYQTPNERDVETEKFSIPTIPGWADNYRRMPNSEERVVTALNNWAQRVVASEIVSETVSMGDYGSQAPKSGRRAKGNGVGPLRTNDEYVLTFDMDTTCPRTFQYLNYTKQIEQKIGRPLTQKECIQLIEQMRAYGQQIPCVYCYAENKRQALKQYFLNFMEARHAVLSTKDTRKAKQLMYGQDGKGGLTKSAATVFKEWRRMYKEGNPYNPTMRELWMSFNNSRNSLFTVLDQMASEGVISGRTKDADILKAAVEHFGITDKRARSIMESLVVEWRLDAIEQKPHQDFKESPVPFVDENAMGVWRDMVDYSNSASQARGVLRYVPYTDELKYVSQEDKDYINGMGGLRMHSSNDFRIDYVTDYFQLIADMAANGWMGHTYTKNPDFVRIFGHTGYRINMSIAAYGGENGTAVVMNEEEGFNWEEARRLREAYPNAGTMWMVVNDAQLEMALNSDWVDMIIPFHASGLPREVWYNMRMWDNYTATQNETFYNSTDMKKALKERGVEVPKKASAAEVKDLFNKEFGIIEIYDKDGKRIRPHFLPGDTVVDGHVIPGHGNSVERYLELCRQYGVHPRFWDRKAKDKDGVEHPLPEHPGYLKVIKETARTDSEQTPIQFNLDQYDEFLGKTSMEYAWEALEGFAKIGGYENLKEDPYGIVQEFLKEFIGKERPLDYITPLARETWKIQKAAIAEALDGQVPYHAEKGVKMSLSGEMGAANLDAADQGERIRNNGIARQMEKEGKSARTIWMATGWEKGKDGQWRYETPDLEVKNPAEWLGSLSDTYKLRDLVGDSELFTAYPDLEDVTVDFNERGDTRGSFLGRKISLNPEFLDKYNESVMELEFLESAGRTSGRYYDRVKDDVDYFGRKAARDMADTVAHEVQHFIQRQEGFARGGNERSARRYVEEYIEKNAVSDVAKDDMRNLYEVGKRMNGISMARSLFKNPRSFLKDMKHFEYSGTRDELIAKGQEVASDYYWEASDEVANWLLAKNDPRADQMNYDKYYDRGMTPDEMAKANVHGDLIDTVLKEMRKEYANSLKQQTGERSLDAALKNVRSTTRMIDDLLKLVKDDSDYELYLRLAGEVEARNVQTRRKMTPDERRGKAPSETEDRRRDQQIVRFSLQGLDGYTEKDVTDQVRDYVGNIMEGEDFKIKDMRVIGSRTTGTAREDSDLDVLVEYTGSIREDDAFNALNDEENRLYIEGIPVDINPITRGKSGTIEQFMERNRGFSKMTPEEKEEAGVRYSLVEDQALIDELENGEKVTGYRNVVMNEDGTLGSPMADKLGGKGQSAKTTPFTFGRWEQADEHPELATDGGKIDLIKPDGLGKVGSVDYNPYVHIRPTLLNKQFKNAWERGNLVYVETQYPESELTSGYKADKAKKAVGKHPWGGGELILTRYDKPVRIVPWEEVADEWEKEFKKSGVHFDIVPPALLPILTERGVKILPPHKNMGKECNEAYKQHKENAGARYSLSDEEYMKAVESGDMAKAQEMVDEKLRQNGYTIRGEHGTTHKFTIFSNVNGNPENSFGIGFYFTSDPADAEQNYSTSNGPDITNRIERLVEQMEYWDGNEDKSYEELREEAEQMLSGGESRVISAALRMENPCIFSYDPNGEFEETYFDFEEPYDEEADEYGEPEGLLVDFVEAVRKELSEGILDDEYFGRADLSAFYEDGGGYTADQLKQRADEVLGGIEDVDGNLVSSEIFRNALERMGFDGIIDNAPSLRFKNMGLGRSTKHYIAFRPEQIKQTDAVTRDDNGNVIPLSQRANVANEDIRYSVSDTFYSPAERAVEGIKQNKATGEQWLKMIEKAGGLKKEEDKWMGLSEWLKDQRGSVTKQDVLDYIRKNQIEVEEVPYQEYFDVDNLPKMQELREEFDELVSMYENRKATVEKEMETFGPEMSEKYGYGWANKLEGKDLERYNDIYDRYEKLTTNATRELAFEDMVDRYGDDFSMAFEVNYGNGKLEPQMDMYGDEISDAAKHFLEFDVQPINSTRLAYTTNGLENKREIALTVPTIEPWNEGDQIHFGDADGGRAVAWVRFGDTTDKDDKKVLVIDEIQSKRHQEGREKGYKENLSKEDLQKRYDDAVEAFEKFKEAHDLSVENADVNAEYFRLKNEVYAARGDLNGVPTPESNSSKVPDAPFQKNWHELAMKRMLRLAAEEGYDKIAWTKGEQQAARYNMGNVIQEIYTFEPDEYAQKYGEFLNIELVPTGNGEPFFVNVDKEGKIMSSDVDEFTGKSLGDVVGKELAVKLMSSEPGSTIKADDLRIGGEGMKGFYDEMLPRFMNKYGKKWGVKVGEVELPNLEEAGQKMWSVDVTPEMKESVMQGQPKFSISPQHEPFKLSDEKKDAEGNRMYERNGSIDLWSATALLAKARRQQAPVRLSERNMKHIISNHSDRLYSEEKVFEFLDNVFANATKLRKARGRGMFVVVENDNTDNVALIKLMPSEDSDYYNVDTAGYYRKSKWKDSEEVIADLSEPSQSDAAADASKPQVPYENGGEPINAEAQVSSSEDKDTKNIDTLQENNQENAIQSRKQAQFDVIQRENPKDPELNHTWVESVDDIKTFDEAFEGYDVNEDLTPDYTSEMAKKARETGKVTVYSSHEIADGAFVTPSRMEAQNYAGEGRVYSKTVPVDDVAWIDPLQGQYAKVDGIQQRYSLGDDIEDEEEGTDDSLIEGVTPEMVDGMRQEISEERPHSLNEAMDEALLKLANQHEENVGSRKNALDIVQRRIREILEAGSGTEENAEAGRAVRSAARAQRRYDEKTVNALTNFVRSMIRAGYLDNVGRGTVTRLLAAVKNSVGSQNIDKQVEAIIDEIAKNQIREAKRLMKKVTTLKGSKINASGVEVQGKLDVRGQNILKAYKEGLKMDAEQIEERIGDIQERMDRSEDETVKAAARAEMEGMLLAQQYAEQVKQKADDLKQLQHDLRHADEELGDKISKEDLRSYKQELKANILQAKIDLAQAYADFLPSLTGSVKEGIDRAKEWEQQELDHKQEIYHMANSDTLGLDSSPIEKKSRSWKNNFVLRFLFSPVATFQTMLGAIAGNAASGRGYLYNYFMPRVMEASNKAFLGKKAATDELDAKVSEVFGRKMHWSDLFGLTSKDGMMVEFFDKEDYRTEMLTQGNLMYIYMVNKMSDGKMKLRKMGISEEDVANIAEHLDPRLLELADWIQNEFLVKLRNKYNAVHEEVFGASMAAIEDYFPLKIASGDRYQEVDLGKKEQDNGLSSTVTGSVIKRTKNTKLLDILNADAADVVLEHIEQMEEWAAYAKVRKDMNTLLSYGRFRNKLSHMDSTLFGSGDAFWEAFKNVASLAVGTYRPRVSRFGADNFIAKVASGVTGAKIAFRMYTALKQVTSFPAFIQDVNPVTFAWYGANPMGSYQWAMDHLPSFKKRVQSRAAGDTRLMLDPSHMRLTWEQALNTLQRWGMSANATVDAVTCAIGARAVYDAARKRYLDYGYSEEEAERKATKDAETAFNESQQSNEGAFVSPIQRDRTAEAIAFTVYRNSSMAYGRNMMTAARRLWNKMSGSEPMDEQVEYMSKMYERDGLTPEQAKRAARKEYMRSIRRDAIAVANYGFVLPFIWTLAGSLPYIIFSGLGGDGGDDDKDWWTDEKKEMIADALKKELMHGSIEGLAGGNVMATIEDALTSGDTSKADIETLPVKSDIRNMLKTLSSDPVRGYVDIFNIAVQAGLGVNPKTITDAVAAVDDAMEGDLGLEKEFWLAFMRINQVPAASVDNFYIDELQMTARDAKKQDIEKLANRWAEYRANRNQPYAFLESDAARNERVEKQRKTALAKMKERNFYTVDEQYKTIRKRVTEMKKQADQMVDAAGTQEEKQKLIDEFKRQPLVTEADSLKGHISNLKKLRKLKKGVTNPDSLDVIERHIQEEKGKAQAILDAYGKQNEALYDANRQLEEAGGK